MTDDEPQSVPGCYCATCSRARVMEAIALHKRHERRERRPSKRVDFSANAQRFLEPPSQTW